MCQKHIADPRSPSVRIENTLREQYHMCIVTQVEPAKPRIIKITIKKAYDTIAHDEILDDA